MDREAVRALEAATYPADLSRGTKIGRDDAPLKLVVYEDFQCPFCLFYTAFFEPHLVSSWVGTNQLQIEFRHFIVLGDESVLAAVAAQCAADQQRFWDYHKALFLLQARLGQLSSEELNVGRFSVAALKEVAIDVGLDAGRFDACLDDLEHLELLQEQQVEARGLGVTGTPTFFLNGEHIRPSSIDEWNATLVQGFEQSD